MKNFKLNIFLFEACIFEYIIACGLMSKYRGYFKT